MLSLVWGVTFRRDVEINPTVEGCCCHFFHIGEGVSLQLQVLISHVGDIVDGLIITIGKNERMRII